MTHPRFSPCSQIPDEASLLDQLAPWENSLTVRQTDTKTWRAGQTDVSPVGGRPRAYWTCTGPPMVEHVTYVEVTVVVVFVRAPVIVGMTSPRFDVTARSTDCRDDHGSTKHPSSLPITLLWPIYTAPDADGCGP